MINWGGLIPSNISFDETIRIAKRIEQSGFSSFWYPDEKFFRDCYVALTLVAKETSKIRLGPCVTDPFSHHPMQTSVSIGSLAEAAPNRVVLGIGAGGRGLREIGYQMEKPAVAIRESIEIIRKLLAGESVTYSGRTKSIDNLPLDFPTPYKIPIMIGTGHGPLIQRLAGEVADIVLLANLCSTEAIAKGLENVEKGAKKAGRSISSLELIARVDVSVNADRKKAQSAVAPKILSALRSSYPGLEYLGILPDFDVPSRLIQVLQKKDHKTKKFYSDPQNSAPLIPETLYENLAIAGTPSEVALKIREISSSKIFTEITIAVVPQQGESLYQAYDDFIEKVMPLV